MKIGIIYAMDNEGDLIISNLSNYKIEEYDGLKFHIGNIGNNDVVVTKSGIGKVGAAIATSYLNIHYHPEFIINSGIAGGSHNLKTRDVILVDKIWYSDVDVTGFGYKYGTMPGMPDYFETDKKYFSLFKDVLEKNNTQFKIANSYSGDSFIMSEDSIPNKGTDDFICDMEGASIAQTCYTLKIPFVEIRFVSDILDSEDHMEEYNKFEKEMSTLSAGITVSIIKKL